MGARYETILITRPDLDDEARKTVITKFEGLIKKGKGKVELSQDWGKQRLTFEVKKHQKGTYHYLGFEGDGDLVQSLERNLKIDESVILFQTHRVDGEFNATLVQPEQRARSPYGGGGYGAKRGREGGDYGGGNDGFDPGMRDEGEDEGWKRE